MKPDGIRVAALLIGAGAVFCCVGPLIITGAGATALVAWLSGSAYALIAGSVIALSCAVLWFWRRRHVCDAEQRVQARQ